jgi:hypothetical protein
VRRDRVRVRCCGRSVGGRFVTSPKSLGGDTIDQQAGRVSDVMVGWWDGCVSHDALIEHLRIVRHDLVLQRSDDYGMSTIRL